VSRGSTGRPGETLDGFSFAGRSGSARHVPTIFDSAQMSETDAEREPQPSEPYKEARAREPMFNLSSVVVAMIALCCGIHLFRFLFLDEDQDLGLILRFAFIPLRYSGGYVIDIYAIVSPLTYSLLHGSAIHLAVNMIWLAAFGSPLALRIGTLRFLLFWVVTALGAVALHYVLHSTDASPLVGASGSISGMMGAAARFAFRIDRGSGTPAFAGRILDIGEVFRSRQVVIFLAVWMVVNIVTGIGVGVPGVANPIAWEAHIGGFLAGFFLLRLFDRVPDPPLESSGEA